VPVLFQSKGFNPALIGITRSLGSFAYTLALPVWGHVDDVVSGPRRTLQIACIPAVIFALVYGSPLPVLAIILCQIVISLGGGPSAALTDPWRYLSTQPMPKRLGGPSAALTDPWRCRFSSTLPRSTRGFA
jgi:MFS family permease